MRVGCDAASSGAMPHVHCRLRSRPIRFVNLLVLVLFLSAIDDKTIFAAASPRAISGAAERNRKLDYWNQVHERERQRKLEEQTAQEERRAEAREEVPELVIAGEELRPEVALPPPEVVVVPPKPSVFDGKGDYVLLGIGFLLISVLTAATLFRHRREAEIRVLKGAYLSDGTEAAWITMPAFFEPPPAVAETMAKQKGEETEAAEDPLKKFFADVPEQLAALRKLLPEFGKAFDDTERQQILAKLHELVYSLKAKADCWELRPVWQLSSALEMLVKRLADKCKEATPSTIRTVAGAVDLLGELCVPGVRPDLIISPPISVLTVDDDPLCSRAVVFALNKAEMHPDIAGTGEKAVELAAEKFYDVIFMDIVMPGIDGLQACEEIHKGKKNKTTPIVFVTVRSDFHTRAKSTLAGGTDLLAKPFLMFEITVKALMFAMRKRLDLAESLRREVAALTGAEQLEGKATVPQFQTPVASTEETKASEVTGKTSEGSEKAPEAAGDTATPEPKKPDAPVLPVTVPVATPPNALSVDEQRRRRKTAKQFKHDVKRKRKTLITD